MLLLDIAPEIVQHIFVVSDMTLLELYVCYSSICHSMMTTLHDILQERCLTYKLDNFLPIESDVCDVAYTYTIHRVLDAMVRSATHHANAFIEYEPCCISRHACLYYTFCLANDFHGAYAPWQVRFHKTKHITIRMKRFLIGTRIDVITPKEMIAGRLNEKGEITFVGSSSSSSFFKHIPWTVWRAFADAINSIPVVSRVSPPAGYTWTTCFYPESLDYKESYRFEIHRHCCVSLSFNGRSLPMRGIRMESHPDCISVRVMVRDARL